VTLFVKVDYVSFYFIYSEVPEETRESYSYLAMGYISDFKRWNIVRELIVLAWRAMTEYFCIFDILL
jgi:hypothetical protein